MDNISVAAPSNIYIIVPLENCFWWILKVWHKTYGIHVWSYLQLLFLFLFCDVVQWQELYDYHLKVQYNATIYRGKLDASMITCLRGVHKCARMNLNLSILSLMVNIITGVLMILITLGMSCRLRWLGVPTILCYKDLLLGKNYCTHWRKCNSRVVAAILASSP